MKKSCTNCIHKDVCIKRSTAIFAFYIAPGRYEAVEDAQANLDVSSDCENWKEDAR